MLCGAFLLPLGEAAKEGFDPWSSVLRAAAEWVSLARTGFKIQGKGTQASSFPRALSLLWDECLGTTKMSVPEPFVTPWHPCSSTSWSRGGCRAVPQPTR